GQAVELVPRVLAAGRAVVFGADVVLGQHVADSVALKPGDLSGAKVRTASFDDVRQLAGRVAAVALVAAIEPDLVGESIHEVVEEPGRFALFIDEAGDAACRIVTLGGPLPECRAVLDH